MVDAVVSFVVQRVGDFLIEQVAFIQGVKEQVTWLKDELIFMQRFLKDAEERQYGDATISSWVFDIRELALDIEDLLDVYYFKAQAGENNEADDGETTLEAKPKSGCFSCICCCRSVKGIKKKVNLYNMGKEIEDFKTKLNELSRRRELYGLQDSGKSKERIGTSHGRSGELRRTYSFAVEVNVVGFEDDFKLLLAQLLNNEPHRTVISIYGMGGLGKSTLARKLYHHKNVKMRFRNCCSWVSVSQDYTVRDLLVRIINSFAIGGIEAKQHEKMNEEDLGRYLNKSLQDCSYLLVVDDVWDQTAWKKLRGAFPDNNNGSRVIITTRDKKVAESSDERFYAHNLRFLKIEESWQLFWNDAFQKYNTNEELKKLAREMVQKCNGLPLAVIVLRGLLARKKPQEWCKVRDHLWKYLKADSIEIGSLLVLSFDCLPYQLKQCFLYLGIFPEDCEISMEKLIHLWVAEGFIPQKEDCIMEDTAKDYLDELINRSLIQVERRYWGRILTCKVHDLIRDLAVEKAKKLNLFYIYGEVQHLDNASTISTYPRQAVYSELLRFAWHENPRLRSLLLFGESPSVTSLCKKYSSLRVLHGSKGYDNVTTNISLKYLWCHANLSTSFRFNFGRLQTLDLFGFHDFVELPSDIYKLQELRHLIGNFENEGVGIDSLTKLQTFKFVKVNWWTKIKTEKLVNLRELWIQGGRQDVFCFDSMANLKRLRMLSVAQGIGKSFASLQPLSHCQHLTELRLFGKIEKLPEDIHQVLPNLQCLSLRKSQLKDDPMPLLEKLPFLTILHLGYKFYSGKKIICSTEGFLLLEILLFYENDFQIEEWQVDKEALPNLKGLRISDELKLTIPERFRSIPTPHPYEYTNYSPNYAFERPQFY